MSETTTTRSAAAAPPAEQLSFDELGTPLREVTFVVADLETTGGSAAEDAITEIGAVKVRGGEIVGESASGAVLVAHNAPFDTGFLRAACVTTGTAWPKPPVLCTARLARRVLTRDEAPSCRLAALARLLHARTRPAHCAGSPPGSSGSRSPSSSPPVPMAPGGGSWRWSGTADSPRPGRHAGG